MNLSVDNSRYNRVCVVAGWVRRSCPGLFPMIWNQDLIPLSGLFCSDLNMVSYTCWFWEENAFFFFLSCCSFNFQRSLRYRRKENINIFLRTKLDRPFPSCHFQLKGVWTFTAKLSRVVMGNFWTELFFVPSWHLRRTSWFSTCNLANSRTVVATAVKCPVLCHLHVVVICRHHYRLHTLVPCEELTTKRVAWLRGGQVLTAAQVGRGGKGTAKWTPELIF